MLEREWEERASIPAHNYHNVSLSNKGVTTDTEIFMMETL